MPAIPHVYRRGAVYYWRRRVPSESIRRLGSHFSVSLGTTNQAFARQVAARLDDEMLRMFERNGTAGSDHRLTGDQIKGIFSAVALEHLGKLERVAAFDRVQLTFDIEESRATDVAMGHVYRLLATHGPNVKMTNKTIVELEAIGLGDAEIHRIATYLVMLRSADGHIDGRGKLKSLLAAVEAAPTTINMSIAQTTKYRAMAAALFDTSSRWDVSAGNDAVLLDALTRDAAASIPSNKASAPRSGDQRRISQDARVADKAPTPNSKQTQSPASREEPQTQAVSGSPVAIAEKLVQGSMKNADDKLHRQVRSTANLLAKYLEQVHHVSDLRDLRQEHLAGFFDFLQNGMYIHYGKSEADFDHSIDELERIWKTKDPAMIGVDKPTAERYSGHIKQLLRTACGQGIALDRDLTFEGLVANTPNKERARNARPTTTVEQARSLFRQPVFVGCGAWDKLAEPGHLIFHGASYFATLLIQYGGERREEICGALVDDVIVDHGPIPYLFIASNKFRRIKNPQSQRPIPIYPELVRLGFLQYVAVIKALGYELLFPDLYSPTSKSPLGDRYHDNLRPILNAAGITAKGTGSHSSRRGFGNNLKQNRVAGEMRADLLGHGGDSETTERYCDHYEIGLLYEEILKLPNVTSHLEAHPINLLPWVAAKQRPPFSHPGRTKEAKARNRAAGMTRVNSAKTGHK